jgi:hypothetical protein
MLKKSLILIGFLFSLWPSNHQVKADEVCRPTINNSSQNYIIGYGSLMEDNSRMATDPRAKDAYPIKVNGFQRIWGINGGHYKTTFLTVIRKKDKWLNAVYYEANENNIMNTDAREGGYCRTKVNRNDLEVLGLQSLPVGDFWIYTIDSNKVTVPTSDYPIVQSYVDIFMSGCLEIQKRYQVPNFAEMCITTTDGWSSYWINDRIHPRRPFVEIPKAGEIDKLMYQHFPDYFNHEISQ